MAARGKRPPYLIVEPDAELARALTIKLGRHAPTVLATTLAEARIAVADRDRWSGVVVELRLPDGGGLELIEQMRVGQPELTALMLSRLHDPSLFAEDPSDKTILAPKPPPAAALSAFLVRSLGITKPVSSLPPMAKRTPPPGAHRPPPGAEDRERFLARARVVRTEAERSGLTSREQQVVGLFVEGRSPDEALSQLNMQSDEYEEIVASILAKTGAHNMGQLALRLVKEAMSEVEPT
jgi:DNA-binding NarL/FixJ family response regulator